jgi:UDP-N-acetylmuramoyl-tripeptide--D-alanyl-D-alanine ligase
MKLTAQTIAEWSGGACLQAGRAGTVVTDTRKLEPGDWYWALKGPNFDGNTLWAKAHDAGCVGAVLDHAPLGWSSGLVLVEDGLEALQSCARRIRKNFSGPVVGITGSSGKTTTRVMISRVLSQRFSTHSTAGNLNNHIGLPLTLLSLEAHHEVMVLEMGMSGPGEIDFLQEIGAPSIRLITNVSLAHAEGSGDLEQTAACKEELFSGARPGDLLIVNQDDPAVAAMALPAGTQVVRFGSSQACDFQLLSVHVEPKDLSTYFVAKTPLGTLELSIPAPGRHIAMDALSAAAVGVGVGLSLKEIKAGLEAYAPVGMRMRIQEMQGGITLLNDAYNANPASTCASLDTLAALEGRRRVALLGDMLELGAFEAESHMLVVEAAVSAGVEVLGLVGERYAAAASVAEGRVELVMAETAEDMGKLLAGKLQSGDVVLLKVSRGLAMERVLQGLGLQEV